MLLLHKSRGVLDTKVNNFSLFRTCLTHEILPVAAAAYLAAGESGLMEAQEAYSGTTTLPPAWQARPPRLRSATSTSTRCGPHILHRIFYVRTNRGSLTRPRQPHPFTPSSRPHTTPCNSGH
jgi:hypothetical protein